MAILAQLSINQEVSFRARTSCGIVYFTMKVKISATKLDQLRVWKRKEQKERKER